MALRVDATPERAFTAFTDEIDRWWRPTGLFQDPPHHLAVGWRTASFAPDQTTELRVRFVPVGTETRVEVEHLGWDAIPQEHAARHGFPLSPFQHRFAEWWQVLLRDPADVAAEDRL